MMSNNNPSLLEFSLCSRFLSSLGVEHDADDETRLDNYKGD
jgi:hypothetical protein